MSIYKPIGNQPFKTALSAKAMKAHEEWVKAVEKSLASKYAEIDRLAGAYVAEKDKYDKKDSELIEERFKELGIDLDQTKGVDIPGITPKDLKNDLNTKYLELGIEHLILQIGQINNSPKKERKAFWRGFIVAIIAALIGATPKIIEEFHKKPQDIHIEFPKIQIVHDTIYTPLKSDTSLIRIVK